VPDIAALQVGRHLGVDVEFMKKRDNKNHWKRWFNHDLNGGLTIEHGGWKPLNIGFCGNMKQVI
jgi:hypothetical protein